MKSSSAPLALFAYGVRRWCPRSLQSVSSAFRAPVQAMSSSPLHFFWLTPYAHDMGSASKSEAVSYIPGSLGRLCGLKKAVLCCEPGKRYKQGYRKKSTPFEGGLWCFD